MNQAKKMQTRDGDQDNTNQKLGLIILASLVLLIGGGWLISLYLRPPVVEVADMKYVQLLRTAVSNQKLDAVKKLEAVLQKKREANELPEKQFDHFQAIIALAVDGDWEQAESACKSFEDAQQFRSR